VQFHRENPPYEPLKANRPNDGLRSARLDRALKSNDSIRSPRHPPSGTAGQRSTPPSERSFPNIGAGRIVTLLFFGIKQMRGRIGTPAIARKVNAI
jgi:hypothetical protein